MSPHVVVTGAAGMLGSATVAAWQATGARVTALSRADLDLADLPAVVAHLSALQPSVILNCAAYNHVDAAESDPMAALAGNAWAVRALARAAAQTRAILVHYSTDFVFAGQVEELLTEVHPTTPQSVYGASKLLGEWLATDAPAHYVLRVESLFGGRASRSTIDRMVESLRAGRSVQAFVDRTVSPSFVPDVITATTALLEHQPPCGVYHCVNTGTATWFEVATHLALTLGRSTTLVEGVRVADVTMRAARPQYAALSNAKLRAVGVTMPTWQDAVARHLGG